MMIGAAPEVFAMFPGYVRHLLIINDADNSGEPAELVKMLAEAQESARSDAAVADIKSHPLIASWRSVFERFGTNPNQRPPSIANLIKRARSGKNLPFINKLVCIFNIISMRHILPAGGDDLDKVSGDVLLGLAAGSETYIPLGGSGETEHPDPGEIILYDTGNLNVFCRAWCWKNGDSSKIDESTRRVAINVDAMPPASGGEAAAAETAALVLRFCDAEVAVHRLSSDNPAVEV